MRMPEEAALLADLVAVPSSTWNEENATRLLLSALPRFGWGGAHLDGVGNVVASRGTGDKELVLLGHIDTVPGGPVHRIEDEVIWGRGAVDAKGPCCAMAVTGGRVAVPDDWRITLIAAVGEEVDSRGARFRLPLHQPEACIIGEPTGSDGVALSYRGRIFFRFAGEDEGGHRSGSPGPMTAAVQATACMLGIVDQLGKGYSIAVMEMEGREKGARTAEISLDLRIPTGADREYLETAIRETAHAYDIRSEIIEYVPPYGVHKSDPVVRAFRNAIRACGATPRVLAKQGTADFNVVSPWGCSMAAFGPGDSRFDHTADERVPIAEFMKGVEVLKRALPMIMV